MPTLSLESITIALLLGAAAALVHSMFQLGVSVLTLLSGHSLGARKAHIRLLHLNGSYIVGALSMLVLVSLGVLTFIEAFAYEERTLWIIAAVLSAVIGCIVTLAYYRRGKGTVLWVPRGMAEYFSSRAKKTRYGIEAAALGAMTIAAELPFAIAPLFILGTILEGYSSDIQISWLVAYSLFVVTPLLVITILLGAGHKLSSIQKWRESNKLFLQYSGGIGLILVAMYITVFHILGVPV